MHQASVLTLNIDMLLKECPGVSTPGLNRVFPVVLLAAGSSAGSISAGARGLDLGSFELSIVWCQTTKTNRKAPHALND